MGFGVVALPFEFNIPFFQEVVAALVAVPGFAWSCYAFGRRKGSKAHREVINRLESELESITADRNQLVRKFATFEDLVKDPRDFWIQNADERTLAAQQVALGTSMPIICVVNFKGGVGKTTICANLAASFAEAGKRVLLVDCDYQGSLSDTVLTQARVQNFSANSHLLIESDNDSLLVRHDAERLSSINSNLWIYPAFYGYSRTEIQMMFRWLVGVDPEIRFNMSSYLQSAPFKEDPQTRFDVVLIDCPPRLLTGAVNALTAATHVLIPTILDGQSHIATLNTLAAIRQFQLKLNPSQKILGIVPSMVNYSGSYTTLEQDYIDELERQAAEFYGSPVPVLTNYPILRKAQLARAGGSQILVANPTMAQPVRQVREMFEDLAGYIDKHVQWRRNDGNDMPPMAMPGQGNRRAAS